ncbi:MAG: metalloregulator ArsR/SmtB family transcription factor [Pseudomonadota bacterium]
MVNYKAPQNSDLDGVFRALSDATRRGILAQLSLGETTVAKLAAPYAMSQPAISKHLRVLERAGLIRRTRRGREHHIQINPRPIEEANGWIAYYANVW